MDQLTDVQFICPYCNTTQDIVASDVSPTQHISCTRCGRDVGSWRELISFRGQASRSRSFDCDDDTGVPAQSSKSIGNN